MMVSTSSYIGAIRRGLAAQPHLRTVAQASCSFRWYELGQTTSVAGGASGMTNVVAVLRRRLCGRTSIARPDAQYRRCPEWRSVKGPKERGLPEPMVVFRMTAIGKETSVCVRMVSANPMRFLQGFPAYSIRLAQLDPQSGIQPGHRTDLQGHRLPFSKTQDHPGGDRPAYDHGGDLARGVFQCLLAGPLGYLRQLVPSIRGTMSFEATRGRGQGPTASRTLATPVPMGFGPGSTALSWL
jgi:hypothetical protein